MVNGRIINDYHHLYDLELSKSDHSHQNQGAEKGVIAMNTNKELVHKSQSILKDFGYDVKTTHLHEMYARLAGYKNIHEATAKNDLKPLFIENIEKILNKLHPECLDTLTIEAHAWVMVAATLNVITRIESQQYRDEIRARTAGISGSR